jgi:hypothetical protein
MTTLSRRALAGRFLGIAAPGTFLIRSQSSSIQDQIDRGPGVVDLAAGTIDAVGLLLDSRVILEGRGREVTVLRIPDGANYPCVLTRRFGELVGTDSTGGEHHFGLRRLTIDGNRANQPSGALNGYGLRFYGSAPSIEDVTIRDCNAAGLTARWSTSAGLSDDNLSMEGRVRGLEVARCAWGGFDWDGPHDTQFEGLTAWENGGVGVRFGPRAGGVQVANGHSWGVSQAYAWQVEATLVQLTNCLGEGAKSGQLRVLANDCVVRGGGWFGVPGHQPANRGILIGRAGAPVGGADIDTKVINCPDGAYVLYADAGSRIRGSVWHPFDRNVFVGTRHAATDIEVVDLYRARTVVKTPMTTRV